MPVSFPKERTKGAIKSPQGPGEAGCHRPVGEQYPASGTAVGSGLGTRSIPGYCSTNVTATIFQVGNSPLKSLCTSSLLWCNAPGSLAMESNSRYLLETFLEAARIANERIKAQAFSLWSLQQGFYTKSGKGPISLKPTKPEKRHPKKARSCFRKDIPLTSYLYPQEQTPTM